MKPDDHEGRYDSKSSDNDDKESGSLDREFNQMTENTSVSSTVDEFDMDVHDFIELINCCYSLLDASEVTYESRMRANRIIEKALSFIENIVDDHLHHWEIRRSK